MIRYASRRTTAGSDCEVWREMNGAQWNKDKRRLCSQELPSKRLIGIRPSTEARCVACVRGVQDKATTGIKNGILCKR